MPTADPGQPTTYDNTIAGLLINRCGGCHGPDGIAGLNLTTYAGLIQGGNSGPVVVPFEPEASILLQVQTGESPHFGQLTEQELSVVSDWIEAGSPES
jgi:hypothetical protein